MSRRAWRHPQDTIRDVAVNVIVIGLLVVLLLSLVVGMLVT